MIGVSPGTRTVGIAIVKNGTLVDWGVKLFKGGWSNDKLVKIIDTLETYIQRYKVSTISIKQNPPCRSSGGLQQLYDKIYTLAQNLNIKIMEYTIDELKGWCNRMPNKHSLVDYICERFPDVGKTIQSTKNIKYHLKTIEAVALVHILMQ